MSLTITARGSSSDKTSASSISISPASNFGAGLAVLVVAYDNSTSTGADPFTSSGTITDTSGNTWTSRAARTNTAASSANDGTIIRVFTSPQNVATLTTTSTITLGSLSTAVVAKAWALWQATSNSGEAYYVTGATTTGSGTAFTFTTGSIAVGDAVVCGLALEADSSGADDADTTNGTWSTGQAANTTGNPTASNQGVRSQYKIQTTTASTQTWNFTTANSDWAAAWIQISDAVTAISSDDPGYGNDEVGIVQVDSEGVPADAVSGNGPVTWSHTIGSGSNRKLLVAAMLEVGPAGTTSTATVTFNGVAMTLAVDGGQGTSSFNKARGLIYYLDESFLPSAGTYTVSVTFSGTSPTRCWGRSLSVTGSSSGDPTSTASFATTTGTTSQTTSISTAGVGGFFFDSVAFADGSTPTANAQQTNIAMYPATPIPGVTGSSFFSSLKRYSGDTSMGWTMSNLANNPNDSLSHAVAGFAPYYDVEKTFLTTYPKTIVVQKN